MYVSARITPISLQGQWCKINPMNNIRSPDIWFTLVSKELPLLLAEVDVPVGTFESSEKLTEAVDDIFVAGPNNPITLPTRSAIPTVEGTPVVIFVDVSEGIKVVGFPFATRMVWPTEFVDRTRVV